LHRLGTCAPSPDVKQLFQPVTNTRPVRSVEALAGLASRKGNRSGMIKAYTMTKSKEQLQMILT